MIECIDLYKAFDGRLVLGGLNLTIPSGQITTVIGRSGEGKSVFLKHLVGLLTPDSGRILVDGTDVVAAGKRTLKRIKDLFGIVFQGGALFDSISILDNVAFPLRHKTKLPEKEIVARAEEMLGLVGLEEHRDKFPSEISGGQAKRVALARALVTHPKIILFDEPLAGLDPITKNTILDLIRELHDRYKFTGVVVSHHIQDMFSLAERVAMLHNGRIIISGTPEEVGRSRDPDVRFFLSGGRERI